MLLMILCIIMTIVAIPMLYVAYDYYNKLKQYGELDVATTLAEYKFNVLFSIELTLILISAVLVFMR